MPPPIPAHGPLVERLKKYRSIINPKHPNGGVLLQDMNDAITALSAPSVPVGDEALEAQFSPIVVKTIKCLASELRKNVGVIASPAICTECGFKIHAPTTGKVLSRCTECYGEMKTISAPAPSGCPSQGGRIAELERELKAAREDLDKALDSELALRRAAAQPSPPPASGECGTPTGTPTVADKGLGRELWDREDMTVQERDQLIANHVAAAVKQAFAKPRIGEMAEWMFDSKKLPTWTLNATAGIGTILRTPLAQDHRTEIARCIAGHAQLAAPGEDGRRDTERLNWLEAEINHIPTTVAIWRNDTRGTFRGAIDAASRPETGKGDNE